MTHPGHLPDDFGYPQSMKSICVYVHCTINIDSTHIMMLREAYSLG